MTFNVTFRKMLTFFKASFMSLWANILEVILEFTMVVILLIVNGNNNFTLLLFKGFNIIHDDLLGLNVKLLNILI